MSHRIYNIFQLDISSIIRSSFRDSLIVSPSCRMARRTRLCQSMNHNFNCVQKALRLASIPKMCIRVRSEHVHLYSILKASRIILCLLLLQFKKSTKANPYSFIVQIKQAPYSCTVQTKHLRISHNDLLVPRSLYQTQRNTILLVLHP